MSSKENYKFMGSRQKLINLYPALDAKSEGLLRVDDVHEIYWEVSGNPNGVPILFVHGGPGAGTAPTHRRFFDPKHYQIILFDQRGAGQSKPYAELHNNTTQHLITDMEAIRCHLGIDKWILFGGSWGSTLSIAYGVAYPGRCLGFILRGIFLGRAFELDWFMRGIQAVFPEAWQAFVDYIPKNEQSDILGAYHKRLVNSERSIHGPAALAWNRFEQDCSTLKHNPRLGELACGNTALALARIEAHYFSNNMFFDENELLEKLHAISFLPARIVQGRYDMVCPVVTAVTLAHSWQNAHITIVPEAGHSAMEPETCAALVEATEAFKLLVN
jgi:proline iminopeptidase